MIKAFFGLWVVVFLPLFFLLFPTSYSPIVIFNEYAEKTRYVETYKGTFYLITNRLKQADSQLWQAEMAKFSQEFGYHLALKHINQWQGDTETYQSLEQNEFVFVNSEPEILLRKIDDSPWVISLNVDNTEEEDILRSSQGTLFLLKQHFKLNEKEQWPNTLAQINNQFSFTLSMQSIGETQLEENHLEALKKNELVWHLGQNSRLDFYFLLPDFETVIKAQQIPVSSVSPLIILAILLIFIIIISVAMFLWVSPLWRDLSKLNAIATKFGDGALDERAKMTSVSTVAKLAHSFNKMADKIEQLFLSQKELTRAIAHDLRTPLYRLRFAFEMVKEDTLSQDDKENYFGAIEKSINDLDQLINQTLVLSRYNNKVDLTQFSHCILADIVNDEINYFKLENSHLTFNFRRDETLVNEQLYVDKRAMIRALNNLLVNAVRYAKSNISISFLADDNDYFIVVEDDGIGIPSEQWDKVFTPFAQLNNEQRSNTVGHGLGLAIVKQIMQWHAGNVELMHSQLTGAKFVLSWPRHKVSHSVPSQLQT